MTAVFQAAVGRIGKVGVSDRPPDVTDDRRLSGKLKFTAAFLECTVIEKILTHLGPEPQPPPKTPAREPVPHAAG